MTFVVTKWSLGIVHWRLAVEGQNEEDDIEDIWDKTL